MNSDGLKTLTVRGCLPLQEGTSGFAIPLFAHPIDPSLRLVQEIDEFRDTIAAFKILEGDISAAGEVTLFGPAASIGEDVIHAFITDDGKAHVGILAELKSLLKEYIDKHPGRIAVILQIQELIGGSQEKKIARSKMRELVLKNSGTSSARAFYEGSTLHAALWQKLVALAPNEGAARRILAARSTLSAEINPDGIIKLDLSALVPADRALFSEQQIVTQLVAEFDTTCGDAETVNNRNTGSRSSESASEILRNIIKTPRQEERIAILLALILRDRETGTKVLHQYTRDRAKFANLALHDLRDTLFSPQQANEISDERKIAALIPRFFTAQYPLSRGHLLYFLAKHLANWSYINIAIKQCLNRTRSIFVDVRRKEIEELLAVRSARG